MNYKKLGSTDVDVSTICLGTMTWGEQNSKADGFKQMDYAIDNGVNFWDTAEIYAIPMREETYGETENIIGEWFKKTKKRDKIILATKVSGPTSKEYIRGGGCSYDKKSMSEALEKSLKRMQTDYIDLYQLHWPERNTNFFGKQGYEHDSNEKNWIAFEEILENLKRFKITNGVVIDATFGLGGYSNAILEILKFCISNFLIILNPICPHICEVAWEMLGNKKSISDTPWPKVDLEYLNDNYIILPIQINGKRRAEIKISKSLSNKEVENLALNHQNIVKFLDKIPKKIIYIPNKIINIVI